MEIPIDLLNQFTMNGEIPVLDWYLDNTSPHSEHQIVLEDESRASFYSKEVVDDFIKKCEEAGTFLLWRNR